MIKYQLIGKYNKPLNIFIFSNSKKDFQEMMGWDDFAFKLHTRKINQKELKERIK